ncbi:MAG: dihydroorotate dehydrogenase [Desulfurococcaceae archaeon]
MFKSARKLSTRKLSSEYYQVEFELLDGVIEKPKPLQFINIWIPGIDEIPMSISQYRENKVSVIFKVVGRGTKALRDTEGFFGVKGPMGKSIALDGYKKLLFIAGGVGIAPLPYLVDYASNYGINVDVVWGTRKGDMIFNVRELVAGVGDIYYATEDCTIGYCGRAIDLAMKLLEKNNGRWEIALGVGPVDMLRELCSSLNKGNFVYISLEALIKCGYGACGSCVLKPLPMLLCRDGPVFKCNEVMPYLENRPQN